MRITKRGADMRHLLVVVAGMSALAGCATAPPSTAGAGSREEAIVAAWERMCRAGYCEGFAGTIREHGDGAILVQIGSASRYVVYSVSGGPGNYSVRIRPTAAAGRSPPSCLEGRISGCTEAPMVGAEARAQAVRLLGGNWRRSQQNLAAQNVPTESATFATTSGDGTIRYKNGATRTLHLTGVSDNGEVRLAEHTPMWQPIDYRCRVINNGNQLQCEGVFINSGVQFPATFFRHQGELPPLTGTEFPFNPGAVPPR